MHVPTKARLLMGWGQTGDLGPFTIYTTKRRKTTWFLKAPPTKPPSTLQIYQRNRFRMAAKAWRALGGDRRDTWSTAAAAAGLYLSGYNLWIFWQLTRDRNALATIERNSNTTLIQD